MSGHGWVVPNPDGSKARCGGPALCLDCAKEARLFRAKEPDFDNEQDEIRWLREQLAANLREIHKVEEFRILLERWLRLRPTATQGRQVLYEDTEKALRG